MDSKQLAELCRKYADDKKAENISILNVREVSSVADYFVICTGTSEPHLRSIVDQISDKLREEHNLRPQAVDGARTNWIVLDFFDVIVHIMKTDARDSYDLDSLWKDAPRIRSRKRPAAIDDGKPKKASAPKAKAKPKAKKPAAE